jgi:catechol 2,3-dioxygenase-like lactoylglutathione lyase family enzyme
MIDHVSLPVRNIVASKQFYEAAFKPLGYKIAFGDEAKKFIAFDIGNDCLFEIFEADATNQEIGKSHVAFHVSSKNTIQDFYKAALQAGGTDNGEPGPRPQYTENYHACLIKDPGGYNIKVMLK